jgi:hypothetical protein
MGRPKGSKNKTKPGEASMSETLLTEMEAKATKTVDQVLEEKDKADFHEKKDIANEKVLVEFYNIEEPGVPLKFAFGPTKRAEKYTLMHGGKYELPRKVIEHLESRQSPIYDYQPDGAGRMRKVLNGYKSRFQCRQVWA